MTVEPVLLVLALLGALYGAATASCLLLVFRRVPALSASRAPAPARWPRLSIVIPACNEEAELEAAVRSRLADDYPGLELVLVDDRSTDATGAIIDRLAEEDPRVRALENCSGFALAPSAGRACLLHVATLPAGWLGKVHALDVGCRAATGELLLLSDADVHVAPGALRRAVALVERDRLDFLTAVPQLLPSGPLIDAAHAAFFRTLFVGARAWAVADPRSRAAFGVGAFNLVRRAALARSPALAHLRLEQADDAALGWMIKRSGGRCALVNGRGEVRLHFYRSLAALARGTEKAGARWPLATTVAVGAVLLAVELGPWLGLALGHGLARAVGAAGAALLVGATLAMARWMRHALAPALLAPLGAAFLAASLVRAGALAWARGGVRWRTTFYATADLRAGRRFGVG